jgi:hypothetical protein
MKYVQAGILASLVVIAGLLFGIYHGQQPSQAEQAATAPDASITLAEAAPPQAAAAVQNPAAENDQAKPSPLPSKRPKRQPAATAKPDPAPEPPAAVSQVEPATNAEPTGSAEPEPLPPVTEPVIPNVPPLVEMPQPEPPPQQRLVTVPEGSPIVVRLINTLSTNRNRPGDSFEAALEEPLHVDGWLVAPKGSRVEGRILESRPAGRVKGVAELSFDLVRLTTADGRNVDISTVAFNQAAEESHVDDMKKIGWGAGIGAIIGAIAGGGKGAAIGAGAGAGAGAGTVLATRGKTVVVPTETRLTFRLREPLEVTSTKTVTL